MKWRSLALRIIIFISLSYIPAASLWPIPEQNTELQSQLGSSFSTTGLSLTQSELAWLENHPIIRIGIGETWAPFVYVKNDGSLEGYDVSYLERINALLGTDIQLIAGQWAEIVAMANARDIDGLAESSVNASRAEHYIFTDSYNRLEYGAVTTPERRGEIQQLKDFNNTRIAYLQGNIWTKNIVDSLDVSSALEAPSEHDAFLMVINGQADYALVPVHQYSSLREIFHETLQFAYIFQEQEFVLETVYSIRKDWPELASILNKAMAAITVSEKNQILEQWLPKPEIAPVETSLSLDDFRTPERVLTALGVIIAVTGMAILVIWIVRGRPRYLLIRDSLLLIAYIFAALVMSTAVSVILLSQTHQYEDEITSTMIEAIYLAFELKQSSDDLTRFARSYAVTGDPKYEHYFNIIQDMRDGILAHPQNFNPFYWDYIAANGGTPAYDGELYSIDESIHQLGLTGTESELLRKAKSESDDLTNLEAIALNAVKGIFQDENGEFSIHGEPDFQLAAAIMFGDDYHRAKARIMQPIDEFFTLIQNRMDAEEDRVHLQNQIIIAVIIMLVGATLLFSVYMFITLQRRIIMPLSVLRDAATSIMQGDFNQHIELSKNDEIGGLANAFNSMARSVEERTSRLTATIESTTDGILVVDLERNITSYNRRFLEIWNIEEVNIQSREERQLIRDYMEKLIDDHSFREKIEALYKKSETIDFTTLKLNDGRIIERYSQPQKLGTQTIGKVWSFRDMTQRYKAEAELRQLSLAVHASPISVIISDAEGIIQYVNPRFCEQTGYSEAESIGKSADFMRSDVHDQSFHQKLWETIREGREWHDEICNKKKNGDLCWMSASIAPIKREDGSISNFVSLQEDITDRKRMRNEVIKAKEIAETATKAKSNFLANMSHEIRTPMNAIIGMAHLIQKTKMTTKQQDYIQKIEQSSHSLLGIINDILDFSKIEAGKLTIENVSFQLEDILHTVSSLIANRAHDKGLELIFDIAADFPESFIGDPLRLQQILINLCSNAVKFTQSGEIVVSAEILDRDGRSLLAKFSVRDSGIGLTKEQQKKLFQSFTQADNSTTRKYGGTGLGLSISKNLAELMGGQIGVSSKKGAGSTFWFTSKLEIQSDENQLELRETRRESISGLNMLIIDDNRDSLRILRSMTQGFGFEVTTASSSEEAMTILQNQRFSILLIDYMMPGTDGIETTEIIRGNQSEEDYPKIIMISAHGRQELMKQADQAGADAFLMKPVTESLLFETISEVLGKEFTHHPIAQEKTELLPDGFEAIRGAKVLLVEDNAFNQQVALELLESEQIHVQIAENGSIALATLQEAADGEFDLVLMDLQMPVMDGFDATQAIRREPRFSTLPIVAMTADAMDGVEQQVIQSGMNDYITKPVNPNALYKSLVHWITPREKQFSKNPELKAADEPAVKDTETQDIDIPGLESQAAITRLGGKRDMYENLLGIFLRDASSTREKILTAIDASDMKKTRIEIHSLKSVAATIGAIELQNMAAEIESDLKSGEDTQAIKKVPQLLSLHREVNDAIAKAGDFTVGEAKSGEPNYAYLDSLADDLFAELQNQEEHSGETAKIFLQAVRGTVFEEQLKQIEFEIQASNFDSALQLLIESGFGTK